jgi:putative toxin-antitoxin system antitoxin component (TIGR02293 family)
MADAEKRALDILGGRALLTRGKARRAPRLEPGELRWAGIIRTGLPARSTQRLAGTLGVSVNELSEQLRLPGRTVHRRLEKGQPLTPEESERNVRAARVLAKAQELLGDDSGREWVLSPCRALGGEVPITLLDTADGFTAVMDELGRLEHGVLS